MEFNEQKIIELYIDEEYSLRQISEMFGVSKTKIKTLLLKNNIKIRSHSEQKQCEKYWLRSFYEKITKTESCWLWNGVILKHGYGQFSKGQKRDSAHRFSYKIHKGEIPKGMVICHKCDNPRCVNPEHLFLGTYKDNTQDMINKNRQRHLKGEEAVSAKLNWEKVNEIRKRYKNEIITMQELANQFNVSLIVISKLLHNKTWIDEKYSIPEDFAISRKRKSVSGSKNTFSKLTEEDVKEIRNLYIKDGISYSKLGEKYNVHKDTIANIIKMKTWKHVK